MNARVEIFTIEVDGSGSVSVNLSDDTVQVARTELVVKGSQDLLQGGGGDVSVAFTVVQPGDWQNNDISQTTDRMTTHILNDLNVSFDTNLKASFSSCCIASASSSSKKWEAMLQKPSKLILPASKMK